MEDLAGKAYFLCRKYMRGEKMIKIAGSRKWSSVTLDTIMDVDMAFEMVSYNPIKTNPSVMIETLLQLIPLLQQDPNINTRQLTEEIVKGIGLPTKLLMPEEEVAAVAEMQMQQQQQMALGGAAGGGGPAPSPEQAAMLEMMAAAAGGEQAAPEESMAAGGGAPIREAG
jgi:hypothetical protein